MYTVEPPIKDTPNKGHLSIRDTCFNPVLILSCIIEPLNKGHLCIIFMVPVCPLYRGSTVYGPKRHEKSPKVVFVRFLGRSSPS